MKHFSGLRFFLFIMLVMVIMTSGSAVAAANSVPVTRITDIRRTITPNDLKPPECASITITRLVDKDGNVKGSTGNDLILGGPGTDTISGGNGADCILGGGGNDGINGNQGNDVILGGPGNDSINGGNGTDICYGNDGTDTFSNCETVYQ
jgi:Ca2+-binding RTX toxin-like protein